MGEAESKKGRGACSTALLLNWMGEPSEQDQEEEETLQLSLGLPGGSRRTACRDKAKKHSAGDSSVLSLGYSTAIPSPQSQGITTSRLGTCMLFLRCFSFFLLVVFIVRCYLNGTMVRLCYNENWTSVHFFLGLFRSD